jgi:hypothetical protein
VLNASTSLRHVRIVHAILVLGVFLDAHAAEQRAGKNEAGYPTLLLATMVFLAGFDGLIAYYIRRSKLFPALEKLRRNANDLEALKQWRFSTGVSLMLAMSISLDGFAFRFLGASRGLSWLFYLPALILMLLWRPKLEPGAHTPGAPAGQ